MEQEAELLYVNAAFVHLKKRTLNISRIDWIEWDYQCSMAKSNFIRVIYGCDSVYIPQASDDARILKEYFRVREENESKQT